MATQSVNTVLLVDDEASQLQRMRYALRAAGFYVLIAADYAGALAIHQRHADAIDILVADLSLPGKNGYELAQTLLARDPSLKVLFTAGHVGAELRRFGATQVGEANFLPKPFRPAELVERVHQLLERCGKTGTAGCGGASA